METLVVPNPSTPPVYGNVGNKPILIFLVLESDGYVGRYCFVDGCIVGQSIPMTNNLFLYVEDHNQALYQF